MIPYSDRAEFWCEVVHLARTLTNMTIELWSYGVSNGRPSTHFTYVWNLELLPNAPLELRRYYNGHHHAVRHAILSTPPAQAILEQALNIARNSDERRVRLAFECFCGIHRSVVMAEALAQLLRVTHRVRVYHRDLQADRKQRRKARRREIYRRAKRRAIHRRHVRGERLRAKRRARRNQPSVMQLFSKFLFECISGRSN